MPSIKWLEVILLFLAFELSQQQGEELDCTHKDNCATSPASVAKITCEHKFGGTDDDCACDPLGTGCPPTTDIKYGDLTFTKCSEWCTSQDGCSFWKYIDEVSKKTCYLMKTGECLSEDPDHQCPYDHSNGNPECRSDKVKDGVCEGDTEKPGSLTCPGPITPVNDPKQFVQKWKCYNPNAQNNEDFKVDMYAVDKMPLYGFCKLDLVDGGSCKTMSPEFRFNCEIDPDDEKKGIWMKAAEVAEDEINGVIKADKLQDVTCTAPELKFEDTGLVTQSGRDIVCSQGGITGDSIPAENYCHMLCDDYDVLSFFTSWTSVGAEKRGWFYQVSDETPVALANADTLDCWGKRF